MTIPAHELFVQQIELLDARRVQTLSLRDVDLVRDANKGREWLVSVVEDLKQKHQQAIDHEVFRWLNDQNCFHEAGRRVFLDASLKGSTEERTTESHSDPVVIDNLMDGLIEYLVRQEEKGIEVRRWHIEHYLEWKIAPRNGPFQWLRSLIVALNDYNYEQSATRMPVNRRDLQANIRRALDGLRALKTITQDHIARDVMRRFPREFQPRFLNESNIASQISALEILSQFEEDELYPLHRADATVNERFFVYQVSRSNWQVSRSSKAEAIADLMELEGFDVKMEIRTIERMCAKFRENRRKLAARLERIGEPTVN